MYIYIYMCVCVENVCGFIYHRWEFVGIGLQHSQACNMEKHM